jgi:hypothetical protein
MKVGIYCRISQDKRGKDKSIEDQTKLVDGEITFALAFCFVQS